MPVTVKAPKPQRALKRGTVFWLEHDGHILLVTRPAKGLLGGMLALPTGPWEIGEPDLTGAPVETAWQITPAAVRHSFTHFELLLDLAVASVAGRPDVAGTWHLIPTLSTTGLPTVFRKVVEAALASNLLGSIRSGIVAPAPNL